MDFLQLVQGLHRIAGASGPTPNTVDGQRGEAQRLVHWIADADYNTQTMWLNWKFLWARTGSSYTINNGLSAPPSNLLTWDYDTFFYRVSATDDWTPLEVVEYETIRNELPVFDSGEPFRAVVMPDNTLSFQPDPDTEYQFRADYYKKPIRLANDTDVSLIPEEYHPSVILGTALGYYADFEDAPELKQRSIELIEGHMRQLEASQLPGQLNQWRMGSNLQVETN